MSVFVDTGVFYAHHDRDAARHDAAVRGIERALSGRLGGLYTTDYVVDETVALMRARTGSFMAAKTVADRILGRAGYPPAFELSFVDEVRFDRALDVFETYRDHPLSFTDATTVAVMAAEGIEHLLSFDTDFDGIVDRLDPTALG